MTATLRTFDLTKSYGGRTVVRGVNLDVASGEIVGLLGPNGAGKTTTFYMTVGLTAPDSGRVELDGVDVTGDPMYVRARKGIGYLPQEASIFRGLTVEQNILAILETMPFDASTPMAMLAKHAYEPPVPPRSIIPSLPIEVETLLLRALEKDPAARFQSAAEMAAACMQAAVKIRQSGAPQPWGPTPFWFVRRRSSNLR